MQFLDFFDFLTNSVMMPIAAIATCLLVSRVIGVEQIAQEVEQDGQRFRRKPVFNFMIRWLCPIFAAIILASSVDRHVNERKQIFRQQNAGFLTGQGGPYENGNLEAADPDSKG